MNNSFLSLENVSQEVDRTPFLRERESELIVILEAIKGVKKSKDWSTLKTTLFDSLAENLSNQIFSEAKKETPDTHKLNRLAGELKWAERYSNLDTLEQSQRLELTQIRKILYGKT